MQQIFQYGLNLSSQTVFNLLSTMCNNSYKHFMTKVAQLMVGLHIVCPPKDHLYVTFIESTAVSISMAKKEIHFPAMFPKQ